MSGSASRRCQILRHTQSLRPSPRESKVAGPALWRIQGCRAIWISALCSSRPSFWMAAVLHQCVFHSAPQLYWFQGLMPTVPPWIRNFHVFTSPGKLMKLLWWSFPMPIEAAEVGPLNQYILFFKSHLLRNNPLCPLTFLVGWYTS